MLTVIMIVVFILNWIILTSSVNDKTRETSFEWFHPLWGAWDGSVALNGLEDRDLDLTLSAHPQYLSFHLSFWFFSMGLYWRKYADDSHCDCERDYLRRAAIEGEVYALLAAGVVYANHINEIQIRHGDQMRFSKILTSISNLCDLVGIDQDEPMPTFLNSADLSTAGFDESAGIDEQKTG